MIRFQPAVSGRIPCLARFPAFGTGGGTLLDVASQPDGDDLPRQAGLVDDPMLEPSKTT